MKNKTIRFAVIGTVLTIIIASLVKCTGVEEKYFYDLLDELQRRYFPQTELNEYIIKDEKLLKRRIKRDVDRAIKKVEPEYGAIIREADKIYQPKFIEKPVNEPDCYTDECKALGGEMRICAPWVEGCVNK